MRMPIALIKRNKFWLILLVLVGLILYSLLYRGNDVEVVKKQRLPRKKVPGITKATTKPLMEFETLMYIRSAFRVSDDEIRLSIVTSHRNFESLTFKFGEKFGKVTLKCQAASCPDVFSPPCTLNGYIGFIKGLEASDDANEISLKSVGSPRMIDVIDVRPSKVGKLYKHKLGVCLQPMYMMSDYAMLVHFFEYWLDEGATKFYMYYESMTPEAKKIIDFYQAHSGADVEYVTWSNLPTQVPEDDAEGRPNPNNYWFRLEVFLSIFDCMHRARFNVKYISQTDLDEIYQINSGQKLAQFIDSLNMGYKDLFSLQFMSRKVHAPVQQLFRAQNPGDITFDLFREFNVNTEAYGKELYSKFIRRPERSLNVHIHKPGTVDRKFLMGRGTHLTVSSKLATILHFRRLNDSNAESENFKTRTESLKLLADRLETNFKDRLSNFKFDMDGKWKNYGRLLGPEVEVCRQKMSLSRHLECHNLLGCELKIPWSKTIDWIRANNSWVVV